MLRIFVLCLGLAPPAMATEFLRLVGHGGPVKGVSISPNGQEALTASFDYALGLWSLDDGAQLARLTGHRAAVNTVLFLPDGRLISGGDDFDIRLWSRDGSSEVLAGHKGKVMSLALSQSGNMLASAAWDGWVGLWDLEKPGTPRLLKGHRSNVTDVAFAEGGSVIYSASSDGTIRKWDTATGDQMAQIVNHGVSWILRLARKSLT